MDKQTKRENRSKHIYETIEKVICGKMDIKTAAILLEYEPNYIYALKKRFEFGNELVYLSRKIGVTVNAKVTQDSINFVCEEFVRCCKQMSENAIIVQGKPDEWFERPTYNLFYDLIKDKIPFKKSIMVQILKEHSLFSSRTREKTIDTKPLSVSVERERMSGVEIQVDGKVNVQFPNDDFTCVAHLAVDAGSNTILDIKFDKQETSAAYIQLFKSVFTNYGVPSTIVADCRPSFTTNKSVGDKNVIIAQGLKDLAELITSSNAKRKNKVESKNDVFQIRILSMLSMMGVRTMAEAQECIYKVVQQVNKDLNNEITAENCYVPFPKNLDFDLLFSTKVERKAHKYSQVQFENKHFFAIRNDEEIVYLKKKVQVEIIKKPNNEILIKYKGKLYNAVEATYSNKQKYNYNYEKRVTVVYKTDRFDFWVNEKWYHLVDNTGKIKKISAGDSVIKVHNEHDEITRIMVNGHIYKHVEGKAKVKSTVSHTTIEYRDAKVRYDSGIQIHGRKYYLVNQSKQVVFPVGTTLNVIIENGIPSHINHKKMMLKLYDINLIDISLYLPTSHHTAEILFNDPSTDVIKMI